MSAIRHKSGNAGGVSIYTVVPACPDFYVVTRKPDMRIEDYPIVAWRISANLVEPMVMFSEVLEGNKWFIRRPDGACDIPHLRKSAVPLAEAFALIGLEHKAYIDNSRSNGGALAVQQS